MVLSILRQNTEANEQSNLSNLGCHESWVIDLGSMTLLSLLSPMPILKVIEYPQIKKIKC